MGLPRLTLEVMKKLPLAGLVDYAFKFGAEKGKNPDKATLTNAYEGLKKTFPKKMYDKLMSAFKAGQNSTSKAEGGMMNARKKNMGLKYKEGGSVKKSSKKSSKKSRGMGAAKRGGSFKGTF